MPTDPLLILDEESFDAAIQNGTGPILVDFWASWCAPCKTLTPILVELAREFQGRARLAKVDVDENGDLANRFGVRSVPTLVLFNEGKVVDQLVGAAPMTRIRQLIEPYTG